MAYRRHEGVDTRIARIIRRCLEIPGQELFQYLDEKGERHGIDSADVNDYLREISGTDFSAKDYRTWAGSALALARLRRTDFGSAREAKSNIVATLREVAQLLGNTPAVCRKAYVHPLVLHAYSNKRIPEGAAKLNRRLRREEARLLVFLREAQVDKPLAQQLAESLRARAKTGRKVRRRRAGAVGQLAADARNQPSPAEVPARG